MKNQKKVKETLRRIKRELSNALYFVDRIEPKPNDKKSARAIEAVRMTVTQVEDLISKDLMFLEQEATLEDRNERSEQLRKALGTINSPTPMMTKTADNFIDGNKQPNALMKKAMQEQIRKASLNNEVRQTRSGH